MSSSTLSSFANPGNLWDLKPFPLLFRPSLTWIMHEAESATQNRPLNFELAAFFCAWEKATQTPAIKNIK